MRAHHFGGNTAGLWSRESFLSRHLKVTSTSSLAVTPRVSILTFVTSNSRPSAAQWRLAADSAAPRAPARFSFVEAAVADTE